MTVCSTGIATPSLEARVAGRMGFRSDVARVPVFGLGCAGGVSGLSIAARLAQARPGTNVLLVAVELCSLALRLDELTKANIVATSLFGDGAAAMILRAGDGGATQIESSGEHLWPDTLGIMGWKVDPEGFGVIFQRTIPNFVTAHLSAAVMQILANMQLSMAEIERFICHPGGARVITALETALALHQGTLDHERQVIADCGNMSAPTVLFVLERARANGLPAAVAVDGARTRLHRKLRHAAARRLTGAELILAVVTLQRVGELVVARHNTRKLMARGAVEVAIGALSIDRRGARGLAAIAVAIRTPPIRERRRASRCISPCRACVAGCYGRSARDGRRGSSFCRASLWWRRDPIDLCRIPTTPSWPARSPCCRWMLDLALACRVFTVLNAAVLTIRIRAENRALASCRRGEVGRMTAMNEWLSEASEIQRRDLARLHPDVPRHVHGDPRHSGGRDLAADDPARAGDFAGCDELDPDRLSDRRDHRHSADRLADAGVDAALAVRRRDQPLHPRLDRLRASAAALRC